jgi:hypothetical protein
VRWSRFLPFYPLDWEKTPEYFWQPEEDWGLMIQGLAKSELSPLLVGEDLGKVT